MEKVQKRGIMEKRKRETEKRLKGRMEEGKEKEGGGRKEEDR